MPQRRLLIFVPIVALPLIGCQPAAATAPAKRAGSYETVAVDPRRNTPLAIKENDAALELIARAKWTEAEARLKRALDADIMFGPAHNNLGKVYFQTDRLYLAAWEFQYAEKLIPNQPEPKTNLGLVAETAGKLAEALALYNQALTIDPRDVQATGNAARVRARKGEHGQELFELLNAIIERDDRPEWVSWARERRALIYPQGVSSTPSIQR